MRYNSESLEIYVMISRNVLLFKGINISFGLLITTRKMHAQFRENRYFEMSTTTNNVITHLVKPVALDGVFHYVLTQAVIIASTLFYHMTNEQACHTALARTIVVFVRFKHI